MEHRGYIQYEVVGRGATPLVARNGEAAAVWGRPVIPRQSVFHTVTQKYFSQLWEETTCQRIPGYKPSNLVYDPVVAMTPAASVKSSGWGSLGEGPSHYIGIVWVPNALFWNISQDNIVLR